jgi:intein/homing endonuclease/uncharacterized protein (DUF362 family)
MRSRVAVVRVKPETILADIDRLHDLAGVERALAPGATTILKDNISWHFPFPAANTTPWQLEGTVRALKARGYHDQVCVQNKTVVTNAFKGEDLNRYVPIFKRYDIPVLYNFEPKDMTWSLYKPKAKMLVLDRIYPEGIQIPNYFHGKNIVHLPTTKCVAGDTEVVVADGSVMTIRELARRSVDQGAHAMIDVDGTTHLLASATVFAMDGAGDVSPHAVAIVSRTQRSGRRVVRLRTRSGRTLTATAEHLMRAPEGWRELGSFSPGDRLAAARRIRVAGESQPLPQTHAAAAPQRVEARLGRRFDVAFVQRVIDEYQAGGTTTDIAAGAGVRWQAVQAILKRHDVPLRRNVAQLRVPAWTSPDFWRWMGYFMAEGCVERSHNCDKFWWVNQEPAIRDEYQRLTRELFGLEAKGQSARGQLHTYSRNLGAFFEELGLEVPLKSGNKRVPSLLFRCPEDEIAAFLSGYLDGDGHIVLRQAEVSATTKSEGLARDLVALFARLGVMAFSRPVERTIPGKWSEPRTYHMVVVSGAPVAVLAQKLTLRHPTKRNRLAAHAERLAGSKQPSNWDVVPLRSELCRSIREGLGLTQSDTGHAGVVNSIENGYSLPTPRIVRELIDVLRRADTEGTFRGQIDQLAALAAEDLAWDVVDETSDVDDEIDLYDLTVPGADCFIGNGLVVHNCHIYTQTTGAMKNAFGGLLNTKRHYTHSWIHKTLVDLLAIQKEIHAGLFAVMDGTTAGDGPGPRTMRPIVKNVMLASDDQVAIDAVAARMMGFDPMSLEYIAVAHEHGLGKGKPEEIEVVGDTDAADERWGFSVGDNGASMVGDLMWFGPLKRFQKLFFHTPLVNVFVMGSEIYHDYYRWPLRDKAIFDRWRRDTGWGRLFDEYGARGALGDAAAKVA